MSYYIYRKDKTTGKAEAYCENVWQVYPRGMSRFRNKETDDLEWLGAECWEVAKMMPRGFESIEKAMSELADYLSEKARRLENEDEETTLKFTYGIGEYWR